MKTCVFIDVNSQQYCIHKKFGMDKKLDFNNYIGECENLGDIVRINVYGTHTDDKINKFIGYLKAIGCTPKYKLIKPSTWYCWDAGITVDIFKMHTSIDHIILAHSSRNMVPVVERALGVGLKVTLLGCGISTELKNISGVNSQEIDEDFISSKGSNEPAKTT